MLRWPLVVVPARWRSSVERDLREDAVRTGLGGRRAEAWIAWQALRIGLRLRIRPPRGRAPRRWGRRLMSHLATDIRSAWRTLLKQPWSSAAIVLTLGLGIGATTAVYAVFNYAAFRPLPGVGERDALVSVYVRPDHASTTISAMAHDRLVAVRSMPAFEGVAAYDSEALPVRVGPSPAPAMRMVTGVTEGYFDLLRVWPAAGRLFTRDEYERPGEPVAVISERLWRTAFDSAPDAVGATVTILRQPFTVIGIAAGFHGVERLGRQDLWVPYGARSLVYDLSSEHQNMVGRLRPGVSLDMAREQAASAVAAAGGIRQDFPDGKVIEYTAVVFPGLTDGIGLTERRLLNLFWTMVAGVAMLMLLACANAANLLVSRNLGRRRTLAVKTALGASGARVTRELLVEAGVLALAAAGLGLGLATILAASFQSDRLLDYLPPLDGLALDGRVVLFALGVASATLLVASAAPSIAAAWRPASDGLRESVRLTPPLGRARTALVAVQVLLSAALVAAGGVLAQSLWHVRTADLGFDRAGLLTVPLRPRQLGYDVAGNDRLFTAIEDRLNGIPGLKAGYAFTGHVGIPQGVAVRRPDAEDVVTVHGRFVSAGYLPAVGLPLVAGRYFTTAEARQSPPAAVTILDASAARQLFGAIDIVGRPVLIASGRRFVPHEIVGVVGDSGWRDFREGPRPAIYQPAMSRLIIGTFHVRTARPIDEALPLVRDAIQSIEPDLPLDGITTVEAELAGLAAAERLVAKVGLLLATIALTIAIAGTYAVVARRVVERTREFGIRAALGARSFDMSWSVVRGTLTIGLTGVAAGLGVYAWISRFLESRLYGISALDPATLAATSLVLMVTALTAAWLPARRAGRVDPAITLRSE